MSDPIPILGSIPDGYFTGLANVTNGQLVEILNEIFLLAGNPVMQISPTIETANFTAIDNVINRLVASAALTTVTAPASPADNERFALKNVSENGNPFTLNGNGNDVQGTVSWLDNDATATVILTDGGSLSWQFNTATSLWMLI